VDKIGDGNDDCQSGLDEAYLGSEREQCDPLLYVRCAFSKECILKEKFCDGTPECPNGEDETFCENSGVCTDTDFPLQCPDQSGCYGRDQICGSSSCAIANNLCSSCDKDSDKPLQCLTSFTCLAREQICDSIFDCPDHSDEALCSGSHACTFNRCAFGECVLDSTADGFVCACDEGFDHPIVNDEHVKTICQPKCSNTQCATDNGGSAENYNCDGTNKAHVCNCADGFDHPYTPLGQANAGEKDDSICLAKCANTHCGDMLDNGRLPGTCQGITVTGGRFYCTCNEGFEHGNVDVGGNIVIGGCVPRPGFFCDNHWHPNSRIGDTIKNCMDGQDEAYHAVRSCSGTEKNCLFSNECAEWCDGTPTCRYGEDEALCQESCLSDEFLCKAGDCQSLGKLCNTDTADCASGEIIDEAVCSDRSSVCNGENELRCLTTLHCITKSDICDGKSDCTDNSDEALCVYSNACSLDRCFYGTCVLDSSADEGYTCNCDADFSHPIINGIEVLTRCDEPCDPTFCLTAAGGAVTAENVLENYKCTGVRDTDTKVCSCSNGHDHPYDQNTGVRKDDTCLDGCPPSTCGTDNSIVGDNKDIGQCKGGINGNDHICLCKPGYDNPVTSTDKEDIDRSICEVKCKDYQCGEDNGVNRGTCKGVETVGKFVCACNKGFEVEKDAEGNEIKNSCVAKCDPSQCDEPGYTGTAICLGPSYNFKCDCKPGFVFGRIPDETDTGAEDCTRCGPQCTMADCNAEGTTYKGACHGTPSQHVCECDADSVYDPAQGICVEKCVVADHTCTENDDLDGCPNFLCTGPRGNAIYTCKEKYGHPIDVSGVEMKDQCRALPCDDSDCDGGICSGNKVEYTCSCFEGMAHPRKINGEQDNTKCGPSCVGTQRSDDPCAADNGYCDGTATEFICVCDKEKDHHINVDGTVNYRACNTKCEPKDCNTDNINAVASCKGAKDNFLCYCNPGYTNPWIDDVANPYTMRDIEKCEVDDHIVSCTHVGEMVISCICETGYFHPLDYNGRKIETICDVPCTDEDAVKVCGAGATSCSGYKKFPICDCSEFHVFSKIQKQCIPNPCFSATNNDKHCSFHGRCVFNEQMDESITCKCDRYYHNPCDENSDRLIKVEPQQNCLQQCVPDECSRDLVTSCGEGATSCEGTMLSPTCYCDAKYYRNVYDKLSRYYGRCEPIPCSNALMLKACGVGVSSCTGTVVQPVCVCEDTVDYMTTYDKTKCIVRPCTDHMNVCNNRGVCIGDYIHYQCRCDANFVQGIDDKANKPTCLKAKCTDNQCGGSFADDKITKFGGCSGDWDIFTCSCHPEYDNPAYLDRSRDLTKCAPKCNEGQCGKADSTTKCHGTKNMYVCDCATNFEHPTIDGIADVTRCVPICDATKCGTASSYTKCTGTINHFQCTCAAEHQHPVDNAGREIKSKCHATCKDTQCGVTDDLAHGTCSGTVDSYTCVCDAKCAVPYRLSSIGLSSFCEEKCTPDQCGGAPNTCDGSIKSYKCKCEAGFEYPKDDADKDICTSCIDIDECKTNPCTDVNAHCENTIGSYCCKCNKDFDLVGGVCSRLGGFGEWLNGDCSQPCGGGQQTRTRLCDKPTHIGDDSYDCVGPLSETASCNNFACSTCEAEKDCDCSISGTVPHFDTGDEPKDDFVYFADYNFNGGVISINDVVNGLQLVNKWTNYLKNFVCPIMRIKDVDRANRIAEKENDIGHVTTMIGSYEEAKFLMRQIIDCNSNEQIRDSLFSTYKKIAHHFYVLEILNKDLTAIATRVVKKINDCNERSTLQHMYGFVYQKNEA